MRAARRVCRSREPRVGSIATPSSDAEGMLVGPVAVADAGLKSYQELKESGVSWLGKVPAHWEVRHLGKRWPHSSD